MNCEPTYDLVRKAQEGDPRAFGRLIERYRSRMETLIRLRMGTSLRRKVEPEDIFQETSLSAFRSLQEFRWLDQGSFFRWMAGIAEHVIQNQARYHFETRKRGGEPDAGPRADAGEPQPDPNELPDMGGVSPLRNLMREERFDRLQKSLLELSRDHREVIILARVEGLPMAEIARRMHRSVDAASMLLLRALRHLKGVFGTTGSLGLPDRALEPPPKIQGPAEPRSMETRGCSPAGLELLRHPSTSGTNGTKWLCDPEGPGLRLGP